MTQPIGWIQNLDTRLASKRFLQKDSLLGSMLGVDEAPDEFMRKSIEYLDGTRNIKNTRILRFIPARLQPVLANGLKRFNNLPGFNRISTGLKFSFLFQAVSGLFKAIGDSVSGFMQTEGNVLSKTFGGIKSGIKSLLKSTGIFAASAWMAVKIPTLMKISTLGPLGILVGTIASIIGGAIAGKLLDRWIDTQGHTQAEPIPLPHDFESPMLMSSNPYVRQIEQMWQTKSYLPPEIQYKPFGSYMR